MTGAERQVYREWIRANVWAEALGLGTTFVLGGLFIPLLDRVESVGAILLGALGAVVHGMLLEGVLVGLAQARVLHRHLPALDPRAWIKATAIGAGLAWLVGMAPSTVFALTAQASEQPAPEPGPLLIYAAAAGLGVLTGPILAVAQWTVLRRHVRGAHRWLLANAAAWAAGMPVIFMGMELVPWTGHPAPIGAAIYMTCAVAGGVVGMIHGRWVVSFGADRV